MSFMDKLFTAMFKIHFEMIQSRANKDFPCKGEVKKFFSVPKNKILRSILIEAFS